MSDPRPAPEPEREIARLGELLLGRTQELTAVLDGRRDAYDAVPDGMLPLRDAARELVDVAPSLVETWATEELAGSRGHFVTLGLAARRIPLRVAAMMRRSLACTDPGTADVLGDLVREWCQELDKSYDLRWVPVAAQTGLHVRTMVDLARRVCGGG
ncbi:hypothetical protein [Streptomyces sp. NPDC002845]